MSAARDPGGPSGSSSSASPRLASTPGAAGRSWWTRSSRCPSLCLRGAAAGSSTSRTTIRSRGSPRSCRPSKSTPARPPACRSLRASSSISVSETRRADLESPVIQPQRLLLALLFPSVVTGASAQTGRVDVAHDGAESAFPASDPDVSQDGRYVVFTSDADDLIAGDDNGVSDVFLRDLLSGTIERVSVGDGEEQGDQPSW